MNVEVVTVGELAYELHLAEGGALTAIVSPGRQLATRAPDCGYKVTGGEVTFATLADRNRLAADHLFATATVATDAEYAVLDASYALAVEAWGREIGQQDLLSGRLLALAAKRTDVVAYLTQRLKSGAPVYDVLHVLEATFPCLETLSLDSLIELAHVLHELTRGASAVLYGPVEDWLALHPEAAIELHRRLVASLVPSVEILFSLCAPASARSDFAAAVDLAEGDAKSTRPAQARLGIQALGRMLLMKLGNSPDATQLRIEALLLEFAHGSDQTLKTFAIEAAVAAMHKTTAFDKPLREIAASGDRRTLKEIATYVFLNVADFLARGDLLDWIDLLMQLAPGDPGIAELDSALARLARKPEFTTEIVDRLSRWVKANGGTGGRDNTPVNNFPDTSRVIAQMPAVLSGLLTDWFLAPELALPANVAALLSPGVLPRTATCTFSTSKIDELDGLSLKLLGRRLLGYVHEPTHLLTMALSLLATKEASNRIFGLLDALLVEQIGYDFPGTTLKAIRQEIERATDAPTIAFLENAAIRIEAPFTALEALPQIGELRIRGDLQRQISLRRSRDMARINREAAKASILSQIATEIPIKAGVRTFSRNREQFSEPIELRQHSFFAEMPRREVLDPVGNSIRLAMFRKSQREHE